MNWSRVALSTVAIVISVAILGSQIAQTLSDPARNAAAASGKSDADADDTVGAHPPAPSASRRVDSEVVTPPQPTLALGLTEAPVLSLSAKLAAARSPQQHCDELLGTIVKDVSQALGKDEGMASERWSYPFLYQVIDRLSHMKKLENEQTSMQSVYACPAQKLFESIASTIANIIKNRLGEVHHEKSQGIVYLAGGYGLIYQTVRGHHWRLGWYPQQRIAHAAAKSLTNFTILHYSFYDEDLHYITKRHQRQSTLQNIFNDYPNFFLTHCSPMMRLRDEDGHKEGSLLPRTIAIPHAPVSRPDLEMDIENQRLWPPFHERKALIIWRGATTGMGQPYSSTDRYRMVKEFTKVPIDKADVAFSGMCQSVTDPSQVPAYRNKLGMKDLTRYQIHLDVDGNTNSWEGLRWRMVTGMATVKVESSQGFTQWYYPMLKHGVHLLHAKVEDVTKVALDLLADPTKAAQLAKNAMELGRKHLIPEGMDVYVDDVIGRAWYFGLHGVDQDWRVQGRYDLKQA